MAMFTTMDMMGMRREGFYKTRENDRQTVNTYKAASSGENITQSGIVHPGTEAPSSGTD